MKTKSFVFAAGLCSCFIFVSCDNENTYTPDEAVVKEFTSKYPDARKVSWETKAGYQVADFHYANTEAEAWFDANGAWLMTETDIPSLTALPAAIQESFNKSEYAAWVVDDIDQLERVNTETLYIIEVEQGEQEVNLHYSESGILIRVIADAGNDTDGGYYPVSIPQQVTDFITRQYPGASVMDFEAEKNGTYEIDILDGKTAKEITLDKSYGWIRTEWEIYYLDLPDAVKTAVATLYGNSRHDDEADVIETAAGIHYIIELEVGNLEKKVKFDQAGNEIK